ncbi:uncharacterized protein LOC107037547 isoform X2 [Diachasma alloeum]|uniref:uncharacterized protein LOC107037547 isoform X2 n=1 Tax=Diachasma alloeum TaxID=454923 RepID=UPI0007382AEE|nr:uncharacterized protein LOC107037547 isoform X2 [Diachasma alloeum]
MYSVLCESRWREGPQGSPMSSEGLCEDQNDSSENEEKNVKMNGEVIEVDLKIPELCLPASPQYVTRQDSGVPEDLSSPSNKTSPENDDEDPNGTMNSDCNITVIHVTDALTEGKDKDNKDGSDSGVEGCTTEIPRVNGYSSSINNLDEVSCDSSLVSCSSVYEDPCGTLPDELLPRTPPISHSREHTSEGGSESSSVTGSTGSRPTPRTSKRPPCTSTTTTKKKPPNPPQKSSRTRPVPQTEPPRPKSRAPVLKPPPPKQTIKLWSAGTPARSRTRSRPSTDSLTLSISSPLAKELEKDLSQRSITRATASSLSKCRTTPISTPSEDFKRPLSTPRSSKPLTRSITVDKTRAKSELHKLETKTIETFGTLPRRRTSKFSLPPTEDPKKSLSRDPSLSRLDKTRKKSLLKPKPPEKTIIYHEASIQTGLTASDIEHLLNGLPARSCGPEVPDRITSDTQTEIQMVPDSFYQALKIQFEDLKNEKDKLEQKLSSTERHLMDERSDHHFTRQELEKNLQRVQAILGTTENPEGNDSLLELESHFQESGQVVANQQVEIANLQSLCRMLNRDLEKSLAAQKNLLQHQQEVEAETLELQEFLHLEKTAMAEAMKELEAELIQKNELLSSKDEELRRAMEECKHLVRMSEQRRQENLSLEMRMSAIERKSRDLLLTQGAAVSGAGVALSGLGNRLEALVDQLVKSYKISEKDLEDVVYHNEAYSKSNSSAESSPVSSRSLNLVPSPKRHSFVSAVIGAIRNAATHPFVMKGEKGTCEKGLFREFRADESEDLLDFETEPCLMMESVLEDVPLHDGYSRNMVSSCDSLRRGFSVPDGGLDGYGDAEMGRSADEFSSLNSLTQAILNRRRVEENEEEETADEEDEEDESGERVQGDYGTAVNLVDQVIDVDNLVTKLLKVLRIIQLENDTCIKELREEKGELEGRLAIAGREDDTEKTEGIAS